MPIAITEDHLSLARVVDDLLTKRQARGLTRALLESPDDTSAAPDLWKEFVSLGWLGLHLPEMYGGSDFGLTEIAVVVEQLGRHVAPGPFVPTVIASALLNALADDDTKSRMLPGFAGGDLVGGIAVAGDVSVADGKARGVLSPVMSAAAADVIVAIAGDDVIVVAADEGVAVSTPKNLDPARRSGVVTLTDAPVTVLPGAAATFTGLVRTLLAAEAVGVAEAATHMASEYAKVRMAFGRPIGQFQAVKHHCANMAIATEVATASTWDATRSFYDGADQFAIAAASAAAFAADAAYLCHNLNTQVHGGIGYTWEHDAHLYVRRSMALNAFLNAEKAATDVFELARRNVVRIKSLELPPEAETIRAEVRDFVSTLDGLNPEQVRARLIESGYMRPQWPSPYGRDAGAVEQLVVEQEFNEAGIARTLDVITAWIILTMIQMGTQDQIDRWVNPALEGKEIWCQLFSEPDAGSDAANIKSRAVRTEGGWILNGQKVWTSGATRCVKGLATVRTDPDAPKHKGVTMMVVEMHAPGVEVRPIKQPDGGSHFCEVFFNDVFIPDADVVGEVNDGWTVARATLGNESISIGNNEGGMIEAPSRLMELYDKHPERWADARARIGRYVASVQASGTMNLRAANRAVLGGGPGPEGAITKIVLSEIGHDGAEIAMKLSIPEVVFFEGEGEFAAKVNFTHRIQSIGGGTSEIKRNQIGERILGLPRDANK